MRADSRHADAVVPSPNFGDRQGRPVDALILHYTGMRTGELARARLLDPTAQVSCHYLVWEHGRVEQLVAEAHRAWHAGHSCWAGERDMNSVSIGIEIVNPGHDGGCPPYPAVQIDAVIALGQDICARHAIAPARVLGHSDIAPERKRDPGEWFPWERLAQAGICVGLVRPRAGNGAPLTASTESPEVLDMQRALRAFGYECPVTGTFDVATECVVAAFQRRYRPTRVDGIADGETRAILENLSLTTTIKLD